MLSNFAKSELADYWQGTLSDYVTGLSWSAETPLLAACSAAGEVVLWRSVDQQVFVLQGAQDQGDRTQSVDAIAFSADGQFLAAAGQDGLVNIWQQGEDHWPLVMTLDNPPKWIDRLAWSPTVNYLAFGLGRYVQVWDVETQTIVTTLPFETSSIQDLAWRSDGAYLAACGNKGAKLWAAADWDADPLLLETPVTATRLAWSKPLQNREAGGSPQHSDPSESFVAIATQDNALYIWPWQDLKAPWRMRGFPGKLRGLAWPDRLGPSGQPWLAVATAEAIAMWEKQVNDDDGWTPWLLDIHDGKVQDLGFRPNTTTLASASSDGWVCLWPDAEEVAQILEGVEAGFSCLAWNRTGQYLAAGGCDGELLVWIDAKIG